MALASDPWVREVLEVACWSSTPQKQGKASVGVARRPAGRWASGPSCQVVVSAEYVAEEPESSRPLHWPLSGRLYLPEGWANDLRRREIAHVPER